MDSDVAGEVREHWRKSKLNFHWSDEKTEELDCHHEAERWDVVIGVLWITLLSQRITL